MANKNTQKDKQMNPVKAGMIGAGIGALAGAAAVALSDEKTRKKIGREIGKLEKKVQMATADTEEKIAELKGKTVKALEPKQEKKKKA